MPREIITPRISIQYLFIRNTRLITRNLSRVSIHVSIWQIRSVHFLINTQSMLYTFVIGTLQNINKNKDKNSKLIANFVKLLYFHADILLENTSIVSKKYSSSSSSSLRIDPFVQIESLLPLVSF